MDWASIVGPSALVSLCAAGVRLAVPTALAAVGETFCERAGVLNLGLEGMMLSGALGSFLGAYYSGNAWVGILAGIAAGVIVGVLKAFLSVTLKTEQVINGIAIVLLAQGLTSFIYGKLFGVTSSPPRIEGLPPVEIPLLSKIPALGRVLFTQSLPVYASLVLVLAIWGTLFYSRLGLSIRAVGERPAAADAAAIHVDRIRWFAVLTCGGMAGLGGAMLIVTQLQLFANNITAGRGWVAIAIVIFGRWNPLWVLAGAFLFGFTDALQLRVQAAGGGINAAVPYEFFQALPYLVTVIVMVASSVAGRRDAQPAALGVPYRKEAMSK
jgi:general nucleoside transport system permease protein